MYESFYGLKEKPFSLLPDPDFLFLSAKHALALSVLEYSLAGETSFCVITGEIGSGKTTLIRALLRRIGRDTTVGLIANTHSGLADITAWALSAFGRGSSGQSDTNIYQEFMHFLIDEYGAGRRCVLIVDEAQNLTLEALEELRLLSNINSDKDLLLQVILVGQPELLAKLKRPELQQFAQRVSLSYHLAPLTYLETRRYIRHRLEVAGSRRAIFSDAAIGMVQYFSGGVPRIVNSVCDMALVYGLGEDRREIDLDLIQRVIADRQASGVAPFAHDGAPDDPATLAEITGMVREALELRAVPAEQEAVTPELPVAPAATPPKADSPAARNGHRSSDNYPWLEVPRTDRRPAYADMRVDALAMQAHERAPEEADTDAGRGSWLKRAFTRTN